MAFDLNMHVHRLLFDEPFFAALSRRIDKREIDQNVFQFARSNSGSPRRSVRYCSQRGRELAEHSARRTRGVTDTPLISKKNAGLVVATDGIDVCHQKEERKEVQRGVAQRQDQLPLPGRLLRLRASRLRGLLAPAVK